MTRKTITNISETRVFLVDYSNQLKAEPHENFFCHTFYSELTVY